MKAYCAPDSIELFTGNINDTTATIKNHYWGPNSTVIKMIENHCTKNCHSKVLEIGPGGVPFKFASNFIGCNETITNYLDIDIDTTKIPHNDDYFDFTYCRHVMEDIQNPDFALREIFRVSKFGGYIETPSPLIEVTKNVDAPTYSDVYCGYMHHRYIVWSNIQKNEIYFLPKYSSILDNFIKYTDTTTRYMCNLINNYPVYWNNYFLYDSKNKPTIIMYKNGVNFRLISSDQEDEYAKLVTRAINESVQNTDYFIQTYAPPSSV